MEEPHRQLVVHIDIEEAVSGQEIEELREKIAQAIDLWCCDSPSEEVDYHRIVLHSSVLVHIDPN